MKFGILLLMICGLLAGCVAPTFETIADGDPAQIVVADAKQILLELPKSAVTDVVTQDYQVYLCDGYVVWVQTMDGGDFNGTIQELSGFTRDQLMVMESREGDFRRYDWIWTAMSEEGELVFRAAVLDDGQYHYCLTAMAEGNVMADWNDVFASFCIA